MKRFLDILLVLLILPIISTLLILTWCVYKTLERGPFLFWSKRIGVNNQIFLMPKIRTMKLETPQLATHLMNDPRQHLIKMGSFLRKSSFDEFPQLWSIFKGDMSFVGPRPALFNQVDLIELRTQREIQKLRPGLTGWAQVNGRDELPILKKVEYDEQYKIKVCFIFDIKILFLTFMNVLLKKGIKH